jgi:Ca2+-binding EF-hand superfamily protein
MISSLKASSEELKEQNAMFEKFDKNMDGHISMEELKEGMKDILDEFTYENSDWESYFRAIDIDHDGKISHSEFTTAALNRVRMMSHENIESVFRVFDDDNSGKIGIEELKKAFKGHIENLNDSGLESASMLRQSITDSAYEDKAWLQILDKADVDKDGEINRAEFAKCMNDVMNHRATMHK